MDPEPGDNWTGLVPQAVDPTPDSNRGADVSTVARDNNRAAAREEHQPADAGPPEDPGPPDSVELPEAAPIDPGTPADPCQPEDPGRPN